MASLAEQAERETLRNLAHQIHQESQQSVFAIGGSIQITNLVSHLICESDDTASEGEHASVIANSTETGTTQDPMCIDLADSDAESESINDGRDNTHNKRCEPVTIRWDTVDQASHKVVLPCPDDQRPAFEQLLRDCQPASFGRDGKDVLDETYRKAGKLDETAFSTNFNPYSLGIIDTITHSLLVNHDPQAKVDQSIRAELYKLNVYSAPSGKFKAHVDTPRSKHQIGSLVICLPNVHEGGQLVLRHQGRKKVFDWSGRKSLDTIHWATFYSDCEHEVVEVTAGDRVTLTYNLYAACTAGPPVVDFRQLELCRTLLMLLNMPGFAKNGLTLGYHCAHAYPHTSTDGISALPATLKGVDKLVYGCLLATKYPVHLRHVPELKEKWLELYYGQDIFAALLTQDPEHFRAILPYYVDNSKRDQDEGYCYDSRYPWMRRDEENNMVEREISLLSDKLVPLRITEVGLGDGVDATEILAEWTQDFSARKVQWLNGPSHKEMALVHGAYGNEASIETPCMPGWLSRLRFHRSWPAELGKLLTSHAMSCRIRTSSAKRRRYCSVVICHEQVD